MYLSHTLKRVHSRYSPTRSSEYLCASPHVHARVRFQCASVCVHAAFMPFVLRLGMNGLRQKLAVWKSEREEQKCREEGRESRRRRRRARIGWWRESGLGLCQMTLARTRPPRWWSREYSYHYQYFLSSPRRSLVRARDGTPEEIHEGHRSHEDEENTVSWETSAELHGCAYILYFVILFQWNISRNFCFALGEILMLTNDKKNIREFRQVEEFGFNEIL